METVYNNPIAAETAPLEEVSMFSRSWKNEILTVPNLLSAARLCLIPVYVRLYQQAVTPEQHLAAGMVLALSCLTDALDGYIARRFHMISRLGQVLDPMADKCTQLALTICLCGKYPFLYPVLGLFLVKELFQLAAFLVHLRRGKALPGALGTGKLCTAVLFISLTALVIFPETPLWIVKLLALTDSGFLAVSFLSYALAYYGAHPRIRDVE